MTIYYIAGPMRGYPEFNFPAFFEAENDLRSVGPKDIEIINPARHDLEGGFEPDGLTGYEDLEAVGFSLKDALSWDLQQVLTADYLVLLKGWENSTGALLEVRTAMAAGIPCQPRYDALHPDQVDLKVHPYEPAKESVNKGEVRITSATGGQKGSKLSQLGAIDPKALYVLGEVAGMGAEKYDTFNYLKGYDWALSYNAMQRHAMQFWSGEDFDEESGLPHMAHAAWHCLAMVSFLLRELGTDGRPKIEKAEPVLRGSMWDEAIARLSFPQKFVIGFDGSNADLRPLTGLIPTYREAAL